MQLIQISPIEAQQFILTLEGMDYRFRLLDRGNVGVFLDVYYGAVSLLTGILCLDRVRLIRSAYLEFPGDLMFVDQQGFNHPSYKDFGNRYLFYYLESGIDDGIGI